MLRFAVRQRASSLGPFTFSSTEHCPRSRVSVVFLIIDFCIRGRAGVSILNEEIGSTTPHVKKGGFGRGLLLGFGAMGVGTAGTIGYAHYDPKFRQQLEVNAPQLKPVLDSVLGEPTLTLRSDEQRPLAAQNNSSPGQLPFSDLKEKISGLISKEEQSNPSDQAASQSLLKTNKDKSQEKSVEPRTEAKQSAGKTKLEPLEPRTDAAEAKANSDLEERIKYAISSAEKKMELVSNAKKETVTAVKQHAKLLREAVDEPKDPKWAEVTAALDLCQYKSKRDNASEMDMKNFMDNLRKIVNDGRSSNLTANNPILLNAAETVNKYQYELDSLNAQVNRARREGQIMNEYRDLIEKSRRQFAEELKSILPNVDLNAKGTKLSEDELNALIAHAHLKVDQLRKQLTEQQVREEEHISEAIERQKAEDMRATEEMLKLEMDRAQGLADVDIERKVGERRSEWQSDLRQQLARAAAAHSEHLEEVVRAQKELLEMEHAQLREEAIQKERDAFHRQVGGALARLQGIESALESRAAQDAENRHAKEMWLACQNLLESVVHGRKGGADSELRRKPLANELMAIKEASTDDPFVREVLKSLSDESIYNGVYTEEDLKTRFLKVYKLGRRTAKIDENGGTLFQYIWSFIMSSLMLDVKKEYLDTDEFDPNKLDTFAVLSRARHYVCDKEDLDGAVRLLQLLRGEPARLASGWIADARNHLETRQAARLLIAHAAAVGMRTMY